MSKENDDTSKELEVGEDATKYGEFISSYFAWVSLPEQKEKVKKLEKITKPNKKEQENSKNWKKNKEKIRKEEVIK